MDLLGNNRGATFAHCFSSVQMLHVQLDSMQAGETLGLQLVLAVTRSHQGIL